MEKVTDNLSKTGWTSGCISSSDHTARQFRVVAAEREDAGRFMVHTNGVLTAFLELQAAIHRRFDAWLHVLLSNQIKVGHATAWMRTRVCASFMLRPSLFSFGFASWFARILRDTLGQWDLISNSLMVYSA